MYVCNRWRGPPRRANEVGAQQGQRGGERRDEEEGMGSVAADEGMLRAASTPYETALSSRASESDSSQEASHLVR